MRDLINIIDLIQTSPRCEFEYFKTYDWSANESEPGIDLITYVIKSMEPDRKLFSDFVSVLLEVFIY